MPMRAGSFRARHALIVSAILLASVATLPTANAQGATVAPYRVCLPLVRVSRAMPNPNPVHHGIATYYTEANGQGACNFDPSPDDLMVAAISTFEYNGAGWCGAYTCM